MPNRDPTQDQTNIFGTIRSACGDVSERARHVRIVHERVPDMVTSLLGRPLTVPDVDPSSHVVDDPATTVAFFLTLATINFGSGYFPHLRKRPGCSGYSTLATSLKERFDTHGPWTAEQLAHVSPDDCAAVFGQTLSDPAMAELMQLFARAWNDLGTFLLEDHDGSFTGCIEAAGHRAGRLVSSLACMPFFRDESSYHALRVPFHKRSQLLASDLALAIGHHRWGRFDDLDQLTIFADNLVPHVLRVHQVLEYSPELAQAIEAEQLIPAGSDEEIEIRACSVHAVELMVHQAASQGVRWTSRNVDQVLWHEGQDPRIKRRGRRHRTRTVFY